LFGILISEVREEVEIKETESGESETTLSFKTLAIVVSILLVLLLAAFAGVILRYWWFKKSNSSNATEQKDVKELLNWKRLE